MHEGNRDSSLPLFLVFQLPFLALIFVLAGCGGLTRDSTGDANVSAARVSAHSKFIYVMHNSPNTISGFRIKHDGSLSSLPDSPFPAPTRVTYLAGKRQFIFAVGIGFDLLLPDKSIVTYKQDPITGTITQVAKLERDFFDLPANPTLDPTGRFLYGVNRGNGVNHAKLETFSVARDGHLTQLDDFDTHAVGLFPLVFHANGRFAYLPAQYNETADGAILRLEMSSATGLPVDAQKIDTGNVFGVQLSPDSKFLVGSSFEADGFHFCIFRLDPETGLPPIRDVAGFHQAIPETCSFTGAGPAWFGFHPSGEFMAVGLWQGGQGSQGFGSPGSVAIYRFNSGQISLVDDTLFVTGFFTRPPVFSADGRFLFVLAWTESRSSIMNVFAFDPETGKLAPVQGSPFDVGLTIGEGDMLIR